VATISESCGDDCMRERLTLRQRFYGIVAAVYRVGSQRHRR